MSEGIAARVRVRDFTNQHRWAVAVDKYWNTMQLIVPVLSQMLVWLDYPLSPGVSRMPVNHPLKGLSKFLLSSLSNVYCQQISLKSRQSHDLGIKLP